MSPSEHRAVRAVELAIIASEGLLVVDGKLYADYGGADTARHALAERAVSEGALIRRYIRLEPPCAWCGCPIKPTDETQEVADRLLHDTPSNPCAHEFDVSIGAYETSVIAAHRPIH